MYNLVIDTVFLSNRTYYDEDSMMLSDDIMMLSDLLLGLNSIDFRFNITHMLELFDCIQVLLAVYYSFSDFFMLFSFQNVVFIN